MGGEFDRERDDDMPDLDHGGVSYEDVEDIQPIEDETMTQIKSEIDEKAQGGEEEDLEDMLLETMFDDEQEQDGEEQGQRTEDDERHNKKQIDVAEEDERPTGVMAENQEEDEPSTAQRNVMSTFESLPRMPDGSIDVDALTMEERKLYNAQVMSLLTENQMDRYECFRRSSLKEPMRKLIQMIVGGGNPKSTDKIVIAMAGVTKVYVGEIIEHARKIAESRGEHGPLTPEMIYEAYTIVSPKSRLESSKPKTRTMRL
ncbi:hypothetical protein M9434_006743 [Picochlorum sp. BPE23]|nr:hypothetical protein M9434_006743 [Picochlorum sp. BPE23]